MSALDAANAHPLAASKLAEWGVGVEDGVAGKRGARGHRGSRGVGGRDRGAGSLQPSCTCINVCFAASGASRCRRPVAARAPLPTVKIKKMCHPQGGIFLSFSGLFRGVFFLRVDFLKGEV